MPKISSRKKRIGYGAFAAVVVVGLAGCGGHHKAAAPPTSTTTPTTIPPTTTTTSTTIPKPKPESPLTGLPQASATQLQDPAVVVKVDNVDQARPQTGINQADIVYEEEVEGGLTRLAVVFQSQYPAVVGPVRSGRLTDEGIADDLNHPVYVFSGTNANFLPILDSQPVTAVNGNNHGEQFHRVGYNAPHNLFSNVVSLAALSTTHAPPAPLFSYVGAGKSFAGAGVAPASHVSISFPAASIAWDYNGVKSGWLRAQNGTADVDAAGQQVDAKNVVLLFVSYVVSGVAGGEGVPPAPIPEAIMTGTGTVWVLSDGKIVKGSWARPNLTTPAVYKDSAGAAINLTPGQTWVELVPIGTTPEVTP